MQNLRQGADPDWARTRSGEARHQSHQYAEGPATSGAASPQVRKRAAGDCTSQRVPDWEGRRKPTSGLGTTGFGASGTRTAPGIGDPTGVEPGRMHGTVPANPERGKAQGRIGPVVASRGNGPQTGVEAQKSTPASSPAHPPLKIATSDRRTGHPDENQSGRTIGTNDTWARTGRNVAIVQDATGERTLSIARRRRVARRVHPAEGSNLRRDEPQERHRARTREGPLAWSGRESPCRR